MATPQSVKNQVATRTIRPMSPAVAEVRTNINLMVEVMKSCMVKDMHFGVIPGVQKPSLFKAGAEKLMATFRLSANPVVEDLSKDGEIRFRVKVEINAKDGSFVGAGIGECSSQEEKFMWRGVVCQKEFEITQETQRRIKFKKDYNNKEGFIELMQVRCNPSDLANTILKMAKKRALVDGVLTATGASDLFSQDIEDLPAEYLHTTEKTTHPEIIVPTQAPEAPKEAVKPVLSNDNAPSDQTPSVDILTAPVGSVVAQFKGIVKGYKTRQVGKTEKKDITDYSVEDENGKLVKITRWGSVHKGVENSICVFLNIVVGEFRDERTYLASEVKTDEQINWEE